MLEDKSPQPAEADAVEAELSPIRRRKRLEFMPKDKKRLKFLLLLLALSVFLLIVTIIGSYTETFWIVGFVAVFSLALVGAAAPFWPLPGSLAALLFAALGMNPVLAAVAAGIAQPIGLMVYFTGGSRMKSTLAKIKGYSKVESWMNRRGGTTTLFLSCAVPGPWDKPAAAIVGAAKYPLVKFYVVCFVGTTIKCFGYALIGYLIYRGT
jgi:membrane protein DedA with SNARE-associated domain